MKIIAKESFIISDGEINASINKGDEFPVYPTNDGMKFLFMGKEHSPYDFIGLFRLIG